MTSYHNELEENDYFDWLCELVCVDGRFTDETYWTLADVLFKTDFRWSLDMDSDRAADGIDLRERYFSEGGKEEYAGPCTVLEMLIGLAGRLDNLIDELDGECRTPILFWNMIDNLELTSFSDRLFEDYPNRHASFLRRIDRRIRAWLDRDISFNGEGGLFPLEDPPCDQAQVDIWYQANSYLVERYL